MQSSIELAKKLQVFEMETYERPCDCCGENDLEEIWAYKYISKTRNHNYLWQVRNVVCKNCGFAFVSPAPTGKALEHYYKDCFSNYKTVREYSIEKRKLLIQRYLDKTDGIFIEIGSNYCPEFDAALQSMFGNILKVELNEVCEKTTTDMGELRGGMADIVASYFVLEHVPDTRAFLGNCARLIRPGGVVILEVPNLLIYPRDPSGLFFFEHVNHFTPATLAALAADCELRLEEISYRECSRNFGFAAVFRKTAVEKGSSPLGQIERLNAIACINGGLEFIHTYEKRVLETRAFLSEYAKQGRKCTIWAANDNCRRLLQNFELPPGILVVDNDRQKADFLGDIPVFHPLDVLAHIKESSGIVILTGTHARAIQDWAVTYAGKDLEETEVRILDMDSLIHQRLVFATEGVSRND